MSKKHYIAIVLVLSILPFCLTSCGLVGLINYPEKIRMRNYYSEKGNYINASGTVTSFKYGENNDKLYLFFEEELIPADTFTSRKFVITGNNLNYVKSNGFDEKVRKTEMKIFGHVSDVNKSAEEGSII